MDNYRDNFLKRTLKQWADLPRPPGSLRARLLWRVAVSTAQDHPDILQAYILPANKRIEWSFAYAFQGMVRPYDTAAAISPVM